jgi:hypothetical protein
MKRGYETFPAGGTSRNAFPQANARGAMAGEGMLRILDTDGLSNMNHSVADSAWSMLKRYKMETQGNSAYRWGKRGFNAPSALDDLQQSSEYGQQASWPALMRKDLDRGAPLIRDHFTGNSTAMPLFKSMFKVAADVDDQGSSNGVLPSNDFCISLINMETTGSSYEHMQLLYPQYSLMFRAQMTVHKLGAQSRITPSKRKQRLLTLSQVNLILYNGRKDVYTMLSDAGLCEERDAKWDASAAEFDYQTAGLIMQLFGYIGVLHGVERAGSVSRSASMRGVITHREVGSVARVCPRGVTPVTNFWGSNTCTPDGAGLWLVLNRRNATKEAGSASSQASHQYNHKDMPIENQGHASDFYWRFEPIIADSHHRIPRPSVDELYTASHASGGYIKVGMVRNNHASMNTITTQASKQLDRLNGRIRRAIYGHAEHATPSETLLAQSLLNQVNIAI